MNKLLILSIILCIYCVGLCVPEAIPVAIQSHRKRLESIETPDVSTAEEPYASHTFEIEPSIQPLRLVFSSESSPLSLAVEKVFRDTPLHYANSGPDVKQDRSGASGPDAHPVNIADDGAGVYNEDEYEIVEHYQRYVPVKVRDNSEKAMSGSADHVVLITPNKVAKPVIKHKVETEKVPDKKEDRSGATGPDAQPVYIADDSAGIYYDDEYEIVDQYQRYVPVTIRDNHERAMSGSSDHVVAIRPDNVAKAGIKRKIKKVKVPAVKSAKLTTAEPLAKQVAPKTVTVQTTPTEKITTTPAPDKKKKVKFGARLARHIKNKKAKSDKKRARSN